MRLGRLLKFYTSTPVPHEFFGHRGLASVAQQLVQPVLPGSARPERDCQVVRLPEVKMVIYHNCGGEPMAGYIDSVTGTLYSDLPKYEALDFHYSVLNYRERSCEQIPDPRVSADSVQREEQRAVHPAVGTNTRIWPGIDVDVQPERTQSKSTPQKLANLKGAGDAAKEWKLP